MSIIKSMLFLLFVGLVILFTIQNWEPVRFRFIGMHMEMPLAFVSILIYIIGAFSGGLVVLMLKKLLRSDIS